MMLPLLLALVLQATPKPITLQWDAPVLPVPYSTRLWCDAAIVKNFAKADLTVGAPQPADLNGVVYATVTASVSLAAGDHACFISIFDGDDRLDSPILPISVTVSPLQNPINRPKNVKVVK